LNAVANVYTRNEQVDVVVVASEHPGLGLHLPAAEVLATCSAPSTPVAALRPLCQDHAQVRVVSVLVDVVHTDMSLQVVRSGVAMLLVWTEWAAKFALVRYSCVGWSAYQMYPGLW
jgi:hypothetical protein